LWSAAPTVRSSSRSSPASPNARTTGAASTGAGASTSASPAAASSPPPRAPGEPSDPHPARPREYLRQARDLLGQPTGSVTLSASAVDAMLKEKGLKDGRLYQRIHDAGAQHLISEDVAQWAHQVSLDPNDSRYADERASMPTTQQAQRCLMFALTLADLLFVLPDRVSRGIAEAEPRP